MSVLTFDVGLAYKLKKAFAASGWQEDEINLLAEREILAQLRQVILGRASVKMEEHVIDCDAQPYMPDGWEVVEHQKGGQYQLDASKINLWSAKSQAERSIGGNELRKELDGKPVLNADVLDYFLANPQLIPEEWKGKYIYFWGTVYRIRDGDLYVRYLCWRGDRWSWGRSWLGDDPAAVRAS